MVRRAPLPHRFDSLAIKAPAKKKKPTKRATKPEAIIQEQVETYLKTVGLAYLHIPPYLLNAGFSNRTLTRGPETWALINAAAEVRGFPDFVIFDPARFGFVLPVELKTEIGTLTGNQRAWQIVLGTKVCRSFESARAEIDRWMVDPVLYWKEAA